MITLTIVPTGTVDAVHTEHPTWSSAEWVLKNFASDRGLRVNASNPAGGSLSYAPYARYGSDLHQATHTWTIREAS